MSPADKLWLQVWAVWLPVLRTFEGVYLRVYLCPAGIWTIGLGSTFYEDGTPVRPTDPPITLERALALAEHTARGEFYRGVMGLCPTLTSVGQLAAISDMAYNIGLRALRMSTLRRTLLARNWAGVPAQIMRWVRGGGRVLPGLVRRRKACVIMFQS